MIAIYFLFDISHYNCDVYFQAFRKQLKFLGVIHKLCNAIRAGGKVVGVCTILGNTEGGGQIIFKGVLQPHIVRNPLL